MPANFWTNYQKNFIVKNISDQGPQGGHRAMHWQTEKQQMFIAKTILDFASKNGWQLIDSVSYSADSIKNWKYFNKNIFPLSHAGFSTSLTNSADYEMFPMWTTTNIKVYKFKTGWEVFEPGTDNSTEENGFVIINDNGTEVSVYHLWGE